MLDAVEPVVDRVPKALDRLNHILGASRVWLARVTEEPPPFGLNPSFGAAELRRELETARAGWDLFLDTQADAEGGRRGSESACESPGSCTTRCCKFAKPLPERDQTTRLTIRTPKVFAHIPTGSGDLLQRCPDHRGERRRRLSHQRRQLLTVIEQRALRGCDIPAGDRPRQAIW